MKSQNLILYLIIVLLIIDLPFIIILSNAKFTIFNENYYKKEFQKYNVYEEFPEKNIEEINSDVLNYFKNKNELIKNNFFNQKEKLHLLDVKNLIQSLLLILNISILFFVLLLIILVYLSKYKKIIKYISKTLIIGSMLTLFFIFSLFILIKTDFIGTFTKFHGLFFKEGSWIFRSSVDNIIKLYPEGFFYDAATKIIINSVISALIILVIGVLILFYKKVTFGD